MKNMIHTVIVETDKKSLILFDESIFAVPYNKNIPTLYILKINSF